VARARDLGIRIGTLEPGTVDAITDVAGVRVGHTTLVSGEDVRTGVTVVLPHEAEPWAEPVFAGAHRLNGNGELTGLEWIRESGMLHSPIALTNTHERVSEARGVETGRAEWVREGGSEVAAKSFRKDARSRSRSTAAARVLGRAKPL